MVLMEINMSLPETKKEVEMRALLRELVEDLASEIEYRYAKTKDHPTMKPKYERDMEVVRRGRRLLDGN